MKLVGGLGGLPEPRHQAITELWVRRRSKAVVDIARRQTTQTTDAIFYNNSVSSSITIIIIIIITFYFVGRPPMTNRELSC